MRAGPIVALVVGLWATEAHAADRWLVISKSDTLPPGLAGQVERAGGRVASSVPSIGLLVVESDSASFRGSASRLGAVQAVVPDFTIQLEDTGPVLEILSEAGAPPSDEDDPYFQLQWGLQAVGAPDAWDAGLTGAGVRIAVMDQGLDCEHVDLVDNIDVEASVSFIPGEGPCNVGPAGTHGTMVAGIAAAADNGRGVIGVAPNAEIVGIKVFPQRSPNTEWSTILEGLAWLATADVQVVNMSFSEALPRGGDPALGLTARDVAEIVHVSDRALFGVWRNGTVLVASAGNQRRNRDTEDPQMVVIPADSPFVVAVSATAPIGWAVDADTDLDVPTTYTNHGTPEISLAAPGGQFRYTGGGMCWMSVPCGSFDLVLAPTSYGWGFGAGTSFSAPHVVGLAALFVEEQGDHARPMRVEAALRQWAEDRGAPGRDPWFGFGRAHSGF